MTPDRPAAFGSLLSRADEPGSGRDRIFLRNHVVSVDIGAFQAERGALQRVRFDVVLEVAGAPARDDDVDSVLSYDTITDAIAAELAAERLNLLETLAERLAARLLREPRAARVFLRIQKLDRGPGALGIEIVRDPAGSPEEGAAGGPAPRPVLVFLSNAAIVSPHLPRWLDGFARLSAPVILCVGLPDSSPPRSVAPAAQRRIDLLAIEQNAWVLAGQDRRCVVVASRTELEWGLRHGQISVWAPPRLVLDSRQKLPADLPALLRWLGERMQARALLCIGAPVPESWPGKGQAIPADAPELPPEAL